MAPWLPVNPNYATGVNVADQQGDPASLLTFYRRLLRLRRATPALVAGDYQALAPASAEHLAFLRHDPAGGQTCLVVLNFAADPQRLALPAEARPARLLFSSAPRGRRVPCTRPSDAGALRGPHRRTRLSAAPPMIELSSSDLAPCRGDCAQAARWTAPLLVAIDGRSGVGKSSFAARLAAALGATVVPGDDFYPGGADAEWDARSPAEKVARVIDWRRLRAEALEPLLAAARDMAAVRLRGRRGLAAAPQTRDPAPVILLDGAYAARPELADLVDLAILVEGPDARRRRRLLAREGPAFMRGWHARWDAAEDYYFGVARRRPPLMS